MEKVFKTEAQWKKELTEEQFRVLRKNATEVPGSGKYNHFYEEGIYHCAACENSLFRSEHKYDSGSGWPSFYKVYDENSIIECVDASHNMHRVEIKCAQCESHLGHVFTDGPEPSGLRYCVNSVSLDFKKNK